MDKLLAILCFLLGAAIVVLAFPEGGIAILATVALVFIGMLIIRTQPSEDSQFLIRIFLVAVIARLTFGLIVHIFELRDFFGGDANTYDLLASKMREVWLGYATPDEIYTGRDTIRLKGIGWGMSYLLAGIYTITGRNIFAAQCIYGVIGAGIAPLIYSCSFQIFKNRRVSKVASILIALSPSFIIWTGQLLKDGIIIFLLVLAMTMVMHLQKKFSYVSLFFLVISLFGIISFRFYIFYMIAMAVVGTFVIGFAGSSQSIFRRVVILILLGLSLTYLGVIRYASTEFERHGNIESLQRSRNDASGRSDSGFAEESDVTTTTGAITTIPIGLAYLLFAPFPWQVASFRQTVTLPDILLWWCCIPFLVSGLIYTVKNRLRGSLGILIFSIMLSLAYSLFQGNVGTAYRQRTQIQVFLYIFVGVGWTLYLERKENEKAKKIAQRESLEQKLRGTLKERKSERDKQSGTDEESEK